MQTYCLFAKNALKRFLTLKKKISNSLKVRRNMESLIKNAYKVIEIPSTLQHTSHTKSHKAAGGNKYDAFVCRQFA